MLGDMGEISPEGRQEISAVHEPLGAVLESSVAALVKDARRDARIVSAIITGMVQSAGGLAMQNGNTAAVKRELKRSVRRILEND
jgi:hypothetical protein